MRALHRFFTRVLNFATRRRGDERLREEIESHLAAQTEENIRAGMTPEEARRQAGVKFGRWRRFGKTTTPKRACHSWKTCCWIFVMRCACFGSLPRSRS